MNNQREVSIAQDTNVLGVLRLRLGGLQDEASTTLIM